MGGGDSKPKDLPVNKETTSPSTKRSSEKQGESDRQKYKTADHEIPDFFSETIFRMAAAQVQKDKEEAKEDQRIKEIDDKKEKLRLEEIARMEKDKRQQRDDEDRRHTAEMSDRRRGEEDKDRRDRDDRKEFEANRLKLEERRYQSELEYKRERLNTETKNSKMDEENIKKTQQHMTGMMMDMWSNANVQQQASYQTFMVERAKMDEQYRNEHAKILETIMALIMNRDAAGLQAHMDEEMANMKREEEKMEKRKKERESEEAQRKSEAEKLDINIKNANSKLEESAKHLDDKAKQASDIASNIEKQKDEISTQMDLAQKGIEKQSQILEEQKQSYITEKNSLEEEGKKHEEEHIAGQNMLNNETNESKEKTAKIENRMESISLSSNRSAGLATMASAANDPLLAPLIKQLNVYLTLTGSTNPEKQAISISNYYSKGNDRRKKWLDLLLVDMGIDISLPIPQRKFTWSDGCSFGCMLEALQKRDAISSDEKCSTSRGVCKEHKKALLFEIEIGDDGKPVKTVRCRPVPTG